MSSATVDADALIARLEQKLEALKPTSPDATLALASDGDGTLWRGDVGDALFERALEQRVLKPEATAPLLEEAAAHGVKLEGDTGDPHVIAQALYVAHREGTYANLPAYQMMAWCFAGFRQDELATYVGDVLEHFRFDEAHRPEMSRVRAWATERGLPFWLVSASPVCIAGAAGVKMDIPIERVVAMEPVIEHGVVQGRMAKEPTYGDGKVNRLRAATDAKLVAAFGDSGYDASLLADSAQPVAIYPNEALKERVAQMDDALIVGVR